MTNELNRLAPSARPDWPSRRIEVVELKRQLDRVLAQVERGRRFIITREGRPIAQLLPAAPAPMGMPAPGPRLR